MTLGGKDKSAYIGDLYDHSAITKNNLQIWWSVNYNGASYNNQTLIAKAPVAYAIIDSGTSFIYLPESEYYAFKDFLGRIDGMDCSQLYCFSNTKTCEILAPSMKSLSFVLDATTYTIPPLGYLLTPDWQYTEKCLVPISYTPDSQKIMILGDTFMRNFYTVFDFKGNKVKLAVNKANAWAD